MGLSIGIVGLPNVGKSTVFNALSGAQNAQVANYPFCTIIPNRAIVAVPDSRVEELSQLVGVPNAIHSTVEFVDIAGLVRGASKGEGLGNQFLGNIRETAAILHVVRCFDDPNVVHIREKPDPREDIEIIDLELILADLQTLERKIERLSSQVKGDKKLLPLLKVAESLEAFLKSGKPVSSFPDREREEFQILDKELRFLSGKPQIFAANVDETGLIEENGYLRSVREYAVSSNKPVVVICAKLEEEMHDMTETEKREFLSLAGAEESGLDQVIRQGFETLSLISFFTKNANEVRAWNVKTGTLAPEAAGEIHTDFERGFIRAEVVPFEIFVQYGNDTAVKSAGLMRLEGRDYVIQDGDVIYFRFNV